MDSRSEEWQENHQHLNDAERLHRKEDLSQTDEIRKEAESQPLTVSSIELPNQQPLNKVATLPSGASPAAGPVLARAKFGHRSVSSPSSLTTRKFGLRPTPSPPRLILDQQTGDIVESYPEQPVYLRTYQPLEDEEDDYPSLNSEDRKQIDLYYDQLRREEQKQLEIHSRAPESDYISSEELLAMSSSHSSRHSQSQQQPNSYRPAIPPPHSGRVYFAPPELSSAPRGGYTDPYSTSAYASQQHVPHLSATRNNNNDTVNDKWQPHQLTDAHNSSFKRALNKVVNNNNNNTNQAQNPQGVSAEPHTTDIAFLTDPRPSLSDCEQRPENLTGNAPTRVKVTATSAARANSLLNKRSGEQQYSSNKKQTSSRKRGATASSSSSNNINNSMCKQQQLVPILQPGIEDFSLYDFCYQFRLLLVCLLSSLIIYLLVGPLHLDCTMNRPTYTYVSIILASVNLICIVIFSLFWYCNNVTRTLYANLSSSAFIVSIYSILVALNLALAILFFFINTCHFQKLITQPQQAVSLQTSHVRRSVELDELRRNNSNVRWGNKEDDFKLVSILNTLKDERKIRRDTNEPTPVDGDPIATDFVDNRKAEKPDKGNRDETANGDDDDDADADDVEADEREEDEQEHQGEILTPRMSPLEAVWEFFCEQMMLLRRFFRHFLFSYDLRFIGALHALCAICFQYMAMKVAVVRSYFCSPVSAYY